LTETSKREDDLSIEKMDVECKVLDKLDSLINEKLELKTLREKILESYEKHSQRMEALKIKR
jgi:hypothetical protein